MGLKMVEINIAQSNQVSDTQFIQALAEWQIIEWSEAQAWGSKGELPKLLVTALDSIKDDAQRNRAYMKAMSAKTYVLNDPFLQMLASKLPGWDKDKLQQLFNFAATL